MPTVPIWNADANRLAFDPGAMTTRSAEDTPPRGAKDSSRVVNLRLPPPVSPTFLLMAAADMHRQSRLIASNEPTK